MTRTDEIITRMSRNWFGNPPQWFVDAIHELRRLAAENADLRIALNEWLEKTDWVQETIQARELGLHRADVMRQRIDSLQSALDLPQIASYDPINDVIKINGKRYAAALFGEDCFKSKPGTLLRIVDGPDDVVIFRVIQCHENVCNWIK